MADPERAFVIPLRRRWLLWILPILALLYFVAVLVLIVQDYRIEGVTHETLALVGAGLFLLVALIEIPFLFRRRAPRPPPPAESWTDEPPPPVPAAAEPAPARAAADDEIRLTDESAQGLRVIEYSAPAKSRNRNAVYTKTHVPVSPTHVVRIETLVADAIDL